MKIRIKKVGWNCYGNKR